MRKRRGKGGNEVKTTVERGREREGEKVRGRETLASYYSPLPVCLVSVASATQEQQHGAGASAAIQYVNPFLTSSAFSFSVCFFLTCQGSLLVHSKCKNTDIFFTMPLLSLSLKLVIL